MRSLSSVEFLDLWEKGSALHPLDRGLMEQIAKDLESQVKSKTKLFEQVS